MKKTIAVVLALCMLLLAACSQSGQTGTTASTGTSSSATTTTTTTGTSSGSSASAGTEQPAAPAAATEYGMPLTADPVKLTMFCALDAKASVSIASLDENRAMQYYEEISGVDIEWFHPSSATTTAEALNVMIASGDLTDIISGITSASDSIDSLINNGIILRLNESIDQYGYYLGSLFKEYPEFYSQVLSYEGNIGLFPSCRLDETTRYFESFIVREDWLADVGLDTPETAADWYEMLTAFKTQDPNGNGEADELPFVSNSNEEMGVPRLGALWGVNACFYKWNATNIIDGKITFATDNPEFINYLTEMNKWYAEGLIDPEYLSTDATSWKEKVLTDKGGTFYGKMNGGIGTLLGSYDYANDADFSLTPLPYATAPDGKQYDMYSQDIFDNGGCAISATCENVEVAVKWLDYLYSEEGRLLASFGVEGETYTLDDQGVPHYTELITNAEGLSQVQAIAKYTIGGISPRPVNDAYYWEAVMATEQQRRVYPTVSVATTERKVPGSLKYSVEDEARLTSLMGDIGTFYKENLHAFIMGTRPISELDAFVSQLKGMGLEEAIGLMQKAYDAYLAAQN